MLRLFSVLMLFVVAASQIFSQSQFQQFINRVSSLSSSSEKTAAVDSFMNVASQSGFPFIEESSAHFIYRGSSTTVHVAGDLNGWNASSDQMSKLSGTNFFYFSQIFENNARLDYKYVLNGNNWILDPLNPHTAPGGFGSNSELAMPGYIQPWEIVYKPAVQHGSVEIFSVSSSLLNRTYQTRVYLPPGYDSLSARRYPAVYFQDGTDYISYGSSQIILDNLIDSNKIEPLIAIFVKPTDRNDEYAFNNRNNYAEFFANSLVPFIDAKYKTDASPQRRMIIGDSFGGNISALISYKFPEVFANCGLHSAAFWPNNYEVYDLIINGAQKDINYFSVWGTYESLFTNMRNFRDIMISKGYDFEWAEFPEGHSWGLWRANTDNILEYFFPAVPTSVAEEKETPLNFTLYQNYPNPFNPETKISFELTQQAFTKLVVYDALGGVVKTIVNRELSAGSYEYSFHTEGLSSGIYFYTLTSGNNTKTNKMILLR